MQLHLVTVDHVHRLQSVRGICPYVQQVTYHTKHHTTHHMMHTKVAQLLFFEFPRVYGASKKIEMHSYKAALGVKKSRSSAFKASGASLGIQ